jgi:glyoxylase-like metal-dependent hydrolase (beta-lactamase superfamily II)
MFLQGADSSIRAYVLGGDRIELRAVSEKDLASVVEVTFLGNCGFFITAGSTRILFDAVHRQTAYPQYSTPEDAFRKMLNREAPFERIDLMLVSHDHPDHITADMAFQVLSNHPETVLVVNDRALTGIRERVPDVKPKAYVIMHNPVNDVRKYEATVKVYPYTIGFISPMEKKLFLKERGGFSR